MSFEYLHLQFQQEFIKLTRDLTKMSNDNHQRRYGNETWQAKSVLNGGLVQLIDRMGTDLSVVRNARVSYDAEWRAGEDEGSDARLIKFLMKNGHNTPFEAPYVTFEIIAPIFVIRQWHRHRTQSYNELSARYKELGCEYFLPEAHTITEQSSDNKQMRTKQMHPDAYGLRELIDKSNTASVAAYRELLLRGCPRELARSVLPVGVYTHMFASANLHNWMRFLKERLHEHAQYEIQVYAMEIAKILSELYPVTMQAFKELNMEKPDETTKSPIASIPSVSADTDGMQQQENTHNHEPTNGKACFKCGRIGCICSLYDK